MNKRRKNGIYSLCPNHLLICKINQARSIGPYVFYSSGIQHASNKHKSNYGVPSHVRGPMSDTKQHYTQRTHFQALEATENCGHRIIQTYHFISYETEVHRV